jgi:hypothetical protein
MDINPDKSQLISYLYGELDCKTKEKIDLKLQQDPSLAAELKAMEQTKLLMAELKDEELPQPLIIPTQVISTGIWQQNWFRVAAALLPLFVALAVILWGNSGQVEPKQELAASGQSKQQAGLSKEEVIQLIAAQQSKNDSLEFRLMQLQQKLNQLPRASNTQKGPLKPEEGELITKEELLATLGQFRLETNQTLSAMLNDERRLNQVYVDQLLSSLNTYYDSRRDEDLKKIEMALTAMQENQQLQRSKTDYLLSELINNPEPRVNNPNKNK